MYLLRGADADEVTPKTNELGVHFERLMHSLCDRGSTQHQQLRTHD
jgi:hypothetical protein